MNLHTPQPPKKTMSDDFNPELNKAIDEALQSVEKDGWNDGIDYVIKFGNGLLKKYEEQNITCGVELLKAFVSVISELKKP